MPKILKFGGAAVASSESIGMIAEIIAARQREEGGVIVVVSAMGDMTNQLISLAHEVHPDPPKRELDMLVSVGERMSGSLLAMALLRRGLRAVSYTGSQSGIITTKDHTNARIIDVRPIRLTHSLSLGEIVIVAGYQGVSESKDITTLGRGGSDTTAVALAVHFQSEVEFFKDVRGIYDKDPKVYPRAQRFTTLSYQKTIELIAAAPSAVLHPRCLALAQSNHIPLRLLSFLDFPNSEKNGTTIIDKGKGGDKRDKRPIYEVAF